MESKFDSNNAMMAVRELNYEADGDLIFAASQKPPTPAPAKFGAVPNIKGTTIDGVPCIAVPVAYLAELLNAVYGDASLARLDGDANIALWIADGAPELEFMSDTLDALRASEVKPLATMTLDQAAEVAAEWIGEEFSTQPYLY